jgi:hypothetical protein
VPLVAALLVTSCSSISEFVVVNGTDKPIEVQYTFKERFATARCCPLGEKPERKSVSDLKGDAPWTPVEEDGYAYNPSAARLTVVVRPAEALLVTRVNNYAGHDAGEDESFALKSVRVTGEGGTIFLEGLQAQAAFGRVEPGLYALTYR